MVGQVRKVPVVVFPVAVPLGVSRPTAVNAVTQWFDVHGPLLFAAAELARRNGGGGHMAVDISLKIDTPMVTDFGALQGYQAEARWRRERANTRCEEMRRGPSQYCFTLAVRLEHEGQAYDWILRMQSTHAPMAVYLAEVERNHQNVEVVWMAGCDGSEEHGAAEREAHSRN